MSENLLDSLTREIEKARRVRDHAQQQLERTTVIGSGVLGVTDAALAAGVTRQTVYRWREAPDQDEVLMQAFGNATGNPLPPRPAAWE